jgi:hypothetical protein
MEQSAPAKLRPKRAPQQQNQITSISKIAPKQTCCGHAKIEAIDAKRKPEAPTKRVIAKPIKDSWEPSNADTVSRYNTVVYGSLDRAFFSSRRHIDGGRR